MSAPTTDRDLWLQWSALDRALETIPPCVHREHRYERGNDCDYCDAHADLADIERQMKVGA